MNKREEDENVGQQDDTKSKHLFKRELELIQRIQLIIQTFQTIIDSSASPSSIRYTIPPSTQYSTTNEKKVKVKFYNPFHFAAIQSLYSNTTNIQTITQDTSMKCSVTPGKSEAIMLFSNHNNQRFVLKTVTKNEGKTLLSMLPDYVDHLKNNQNTTTLCKFYLFFKFRFNFKQVRMVVMNNVFDTDLKIERLYDLKGSMIGREATDNELEKQQYKDKEFIQHLEQKELTLTIDPSIKQLLLKQLQSDIELLRRHKIMDYSLLLGIITSPDTTVTTSLQHIPIQNSDKVLLLGIIDILQLFNTKKQVARTLKSIKYGDKRDELSTVPPSMYAQRFYEFIEKGLLQ
jgi:hypothetical protein